MKKKEERMRRCLKKTLGIFVLLVLTLMFTLPALSYEPVLDINLKVNSNYYALGDTIDISAMNYVNGILVLSIPISVEVKDPLGNVDLVKMTGYTDGNYKGSYKPEVKGNYKITAYGEINGELTNTTIDVIVLGPEIDFSINLPEEIEYDYGPVDVKGQIKVKSKGQNINKKIELMVMSPGSPFFNHLCDVQCDGECDFSCKLSQNIELSDHYIIAKVIHNGIESIAKDSFKLVLPETQNLNLSLDHDKVYFSNETQAITVLADINSYPLESAMVNVEIVGPNNDSTILLADELLPGKYSVSYNAMRVGDYSIFATVAKNTIYGTARSNFTVVESDNYIIPSDVRLAYDVKSNKKYVLGDINVSLINTNLIDLSNVPVDINLSSLHIIGNNKRFRLNASEEIVSLPDYYIDLFSQAGNITKLTVEAEVIDSPVSGIYYDLGRKEGLDRLSFFNDNSEAVMPVYRYEYLMPINESVKFIVDSAGVPITSWSIDYGKLVVYSSEDSVQIFYESIVENAVNIIDVKKSSEEILQKENLVLEIISNDNGSAYNTILLYSSEGNVVVNHSVDSTFTFSTDNNTRVGTYNYIITSIGINGTYDSHWGSFLVLSSKPRISIDNEYSEQSQRNAYIDFKHVIWNENFKDSDVVNLFDESNFTDVEYYYSNMTKLLDSNKDGFVDTGLMLPGERMEIIARHIVPSNVEIGASDRIIIYAKSVSDQNKFDYSVNDLEIVAFKETKVEEHYDDIALLSLEELNGNLLLKVKNYDNVPKIVDFMLELNISGINELTKEYERLLAPGVIETIILKTPKMNESHLVRVSVVDSNKELLKDYNQDNNFRMLAVDENWYIDSSEFRLPISVRETLNVNHTKFIVRAYVDFEEYSIENIIPVYFDGVSHKYANYESTDFDETSNSGYITFELENIPKNLESVMYIYLMTNSTDYENKKFNYDVIINNDRARTSGRWVRDRQIVGYYGGDYLHDLNSDKGWKAINFYPNLKLDNYEVYAFYPSSDSFASNVPVLINSYDGTNYVELNQKQGGGEWNYIGAYNLNSTSYVTVGNYGTEGLVVADAFLFRQVSYYGSPKRVQQNINGTVISLGEEVIDMNTETVKEFYNTTINVSMNSDAVINLSEYFISLAYLSYNASSELSVKFDNSTVVITPGENITGIGHFIISDIIKEIDFIINITSNETINKSIVVLNQTQNESNASLENITVDMNATANLSIENFTLNISEIEVEQNTTANLTLLPSKFNMSGFEKEGMLIGDIEDGKAVIQKQAVVGEPVRWSIVANRTAINDSLIEIPYDAENVTVFDEKNKTVGFNFSVSNKTASEEEFGKIRELKNLEVELSEIFEEKKDANIIKKSLLKISEISVQNDIAEAEAVVTKFDNPEDTAVFVNTSLDTIKVEYETEAPKLKEAKEVLQDFSIKKNVTVYSEVSMHYYNILTRANISEARPEQVKLFWKVNGTRKNVIDDPKFNVTFIDTDDDGLIEQIEWITPRLSEQLFEIEIDLTILTIQSYPTLFKNWTVLFNTSGISNLTIGPSNGTTWGEFFTDITTSSDDLLFLELYCGEETRKDSNLLVRLRDGTIIDYSSITASDSYEVEKLIYPNWNCNETGKLIDQVITTGKHDIEFEFGNDVGYAHNFAYLLYDDFESYATGGNASDFVDYNSVGGIVDTYSIFSNGSNKFMRGNASVGGNTFYYSEYNKSTEAWQNYEVRTKMRITQDNGDQENGIFVFTDVPSGQYYRLYSSSGTYALSGSSFLQADPVLDTGVAPVVGTWYNLRMQATTNGTHSFIKAKVWNESESEPVSWQAGARNPDVVTPITNGSVAFYVKDGVADFDYIVVENMSHAPTITIQEPPLSSIYSIGETVWFNITLDKGTKNCSYKVDGTITNMTRMNETFFNASQSFGTFGLREVTFYCVDYQNNSVNTTRSFQVGLTPAGTYLVNSTGTLQKSFAFGKYYDMYLNDTHDAIVLNDTYTGSYESQVFDSGASEVGYEADWKTLSWSVEGAGELPNNGAVELYANMSGNVLLLHMNEASGSIMDTSGSALSGLPTGGPTYQTPSAYADLNYSITLDGTDDWFDIGALGISGADARTIMGWVRTADTSQSGWTDIFGFAGGTGSNEFFDIEVDGGGGCAGNGYILHVYGWEDCIMNNWDTNWHHIAATYDGTTMRAYLDGEEVISQARALSTVDNFHIGKRNDNTEYFDGQVDEVAVWNRQLSQTEIREIYNRGAMEYNLSIKSCNLSDCSDVLYTMIEKSDPYTIDITDARYFQYNFSFSSINDSYSPRLFNVTIEYDVDIAPTKFIDYFMNDSYTSDYNDVLFFTTSDGGVELGSKCITYPFEAGCWRYRQAISLLEIGGVDNGEYPFNVSFDSRPMVSGGKMNSDCSDVRITWYNISSGSEEEVYFWGEEGYCNTSTTNYWIKAPYLNASEEHTFYMYYGNSAASASTYEDGDNVFDFFDDFNANGLDWGKWTPESTYYNFPWGEGYIEYWTQGNDRPAIYSNSDYADGQVMWRIHTINDDNDFDGAMVIRDNDLNDNAPDGYAFMLDSRDATNNGIVEGRFATTHATYPTFVPQDKWIRGRATFDGPDLSFWNDYHDMIITASDSSVSTGRLELWADSDNSGRRAWMDWVGYIDRTTNDYIVSIGDAEIEYESYGNLTSIDFNPEYFRAWEAVFVDFEIDANDQTNVTFKVLDKWDNDLCTFEISEDISEYDISGCAYGYDTVKIFGELTTTNSSLSPIINSWGVSWTIANNVWIDEPDNTYLERFVDFAINGSLESTEDSCNIEVDTQYKLVGQSDQFFEDDYVDFSSYESITDIYVSDQLILEPQSSTYSWYDSSWNNRKEFTVMLDHDAKDYPVNVTFASTDLTFSDTDSFQNIRFTYYNSSSKQETLLNHWLESYSGTEAKVWIKVPSLKASTTSTLFMYYNNSAATDISDGDSVFKFFDGFSGTNLDSSKWIDNEAGYTISGGEFHGNDYNDREFIFTKEYTVSAGEMVYYSLRANVNNPGDWDGGIGVGTWSFVDDDGCGQCLNIDRNRWWRDDLGNCGVARINEATYHTYRVWVEDSWSAFYDLTQTRFNNGSGTTFGPLYVINDGESGDGHTILDWIFIKDAGSDPTIVMQADEASNFTSSGNYTSSSFDTGAATVFWDKIEYSSSKPLGTTMKVYTRTSHDGSYWTDWEFQQDNKEITSEGRRYIQYLVQMNSTDEQKTPQLNSISLSYMTAEPYFSDMSMLDTTFGNNDNPYSCGVMNNTDMCYPFWNTVTPKVRGKFLLRLHGEGQGSCTYDDYSNEKVVYVFAKSQINNFVTDKTPVARGDSILLSGKLTDDLLVNLVDKEILFYEGTNLLGSTLTDSGGAFSFAYSIPSNETVGIHTYKAIFEKDYKYYYLPTSSTVDVKISSVPVVHNITISPDPAGTRDTITINSSITDEVGLGSVSIEITYPDNTVKTGTMNSPLSDGNYSYTFSDTWDVGHYSVVITANNTDGITAQSNTIFDVEIYGESTVQLTKDTYLSYEDVLISSTPADWWNSSWIYRMDLNLTTPSVTTPAGFQANIILNSTNVGSNFNWSLLCADIRFMNGTNEQVLPYWIESCNDTNKHASVWVRVDEEIDPTGTLIYMYYGNFGASDGSSGQDTFLLYETFDENIGSKGVGDIPDGWAHYGSGDVYLAYDELTESWCLNKTGNNDPNGGYTNFSESVSDFQATFYSKRIWSLAGTQNRYSISAYDGSSFTGGYGPAVRGWDGNNAFDIERRNVGGGATDLTNNNWILNSNEWYKWVFTRYGNDMNFTVYDSDGNFEETILDTEGTFSTFDSFFVHGGWESYTDDIIVRRYIDENIGVEFGSEEKGPTGIFNRGNTNIRGYRWAIVQKYNEGSSTWTDVNPAVINDYAFSSLKTISAHEFLDVETEWNTFPWNTDDYDAGTYRVKIALVGNFSNPSLDSSIIVDSNGNKIVSYYSFSILEARLFLNNITYPNVYDYGIAEYETGDTIDWINVTLKAENNTAIDVNTTLTLLDKLNSGYAGFGPNNETKGYGNIAVNATKTMTWDNATNGYIISEDLVTGTYQLKWKVEWEVMNGPEDVNMTRYVRVHNIPSNITTTSLDRLYINESIDYNLSITNLWSSRNITDVKITLNCPNATGLVCNCSSPGPAGDTCDLGIISNLAAEIASFNISANDSTPRGDYKINFTVNYTNPGAIAKSWVEIIPATLEIRERGIVEIFDYSHNTTGIRFGDVYYAEYVNNTGSVPLTDVWLNYTTIPTAWTITSGAQDVTIANLAINDIMWNNVTFAIGGGAALGPQSIILNSSSPDGKPDFKSLTTTVYANTTFSDMDANDTNVSRGENIRINATLTWDNGSALSGETVYFYDQTNDTLIGSDVTDSNGLAEVIYNIDATVSLGSHILNVTYLGKAAKYALETYRNMTIDVGLVPTIHSLTDSPDPVGYGYNVSIDVNVTDDDTISTAILYLTYPDSTFKSYPMSSVGSDIYRYMFNNTWYNGTYSYYVTVTDDTGSSNTTSSNTFQVISDGLFKFSTINSSYGQFEDVNISHPVWWNHSWRYRQAFDISVPSGVTEEGYQVYIILNDSNVGNSFDWNNACQDIRFVNSSHNAELSYWLESCSVAGKKAKVWVRMEDNITTTASTVYLYYGNDDVANNSNAATTFDTFGNFWQGWKYDTSTSCSGTAGWDERGFDDTTWGELADVRIDNFGACDNCDFYQRKQVILTSVGTTSLEVQSDDGHWIYANGIFAKQSGGLCHIGGASTLTTDITSYLKKGLNVIGVHCSEAGGGERCDINTMTIPNSYTVKYSYPEPTYSIDSEEETYGFSTGVRGHLVAKVQRYSGGSWSDVSTYIDDYSSSTMRSFGNDTIFNLSSIWNPSPWNTGTAQDGNYRIYAYLMSPYGSILKGTQGNIAGNATFTITPPETNVTIDNIRLYIVNDATKYAGGNLNDSGTNKTFTLFENKTYRVEVVLKNQVGSPDWNLSKVNISKSGLNQSWPIDTLTDIWYKIGSGASNVGGNYTNGKVIWNTTGLGGNVSENTQVTFYYIFNTTINSTADYNVVFNISDPYFNKLDNSVFHVVKESQKTPEIVFNQYGLTRTEVVRGFNTTTIYGRWDQEIASADIFYNATISAIISDSITLPSPNPYNWTNYTFNPSASWLLGQHVAKIEATNPSGAENDTLSFLTFDVYGLAHIEDLTLNASTIGLGETVNIKCGIEDDSNNLPIIGYNITLYSNGILINSNLSDSNGYIEYNYTPATFGIFNVVCNISEDGWYKTDARYQSSASIFIKEYEEPDYSNVAGTSIIHKTETATFDARWTDNAQLAYGILETNITGSYMNTSVAMTGIDDWSNFSYVIGAGVTPGYATWRIHGNDTSDNYNTTPDAFIEVWGWADVESFDVSPGTINPGNDVNATCRIVDSNSSSGIQNYNVSFYIDGDFIGWNTTNSTGYAVYGFTNNTVMLHTVSCNITDQASLYYNSSTASLTDTLVVTLSADTEPPQADTYTINDTLIMRNECVGVSAHWNEPINFSRLYYNMSGAFVYDNLSGPYTNDWTNGSVCTNNSWSVGGHGIRIWVNDSSGNINDSASYLDFTMRSRSRVDWVSPSGVMARGLTNLTCQVKDNFTNEAISGYLVQFYGPSGFIGSGMSNSTGHVTVLDNTSVYGTGNQAFQCNIVSQGFYLTSAPDNKGTTTLIFSGSVVPSITEPLSTDRLYIGQDYRLRSNTTDDSSNPIIPDNISWYYANGTEIGNGTPIDWTVPTDITVGNLTLNITAQKVNYADGYSHENFSIWTWAKINDSELNPNKTFVNMTITARCQIIDANLSTPLEGVEVEFFSNGYPWAGGGLGSNITQANGWAQVKFNYSFSTVDTVTCRIRNQQYFNVSAPTTMGRILNVTKAGVDLAVSGFIAPSVTYGCTYNPYYTVVANISNLGIAIDDINISYYINGTLNQSELRNFSTAEWVLYNYTNFFNDTTRYWSEVKILSVDDGDTSNNNGSVFIDKHLVNISYWNRMESISDNIYNSTVYLSNNVNCSLENVSLIGFVPENMTLVYNSTQHNESGIATGSYYGTSYTWWRTLPALGNDSLYYHIEGEKDYMVSSAFVQAIAANVHE